MKPYALAALATIFLTAAGSAPVGAVIHLVTTWEPLTNCQPDSTNPWPPDALQYGQGGLRNNAPYPAFVFCAINPAGATAGSTFVYVYANGPTGRVISCTFTNGFAHVYSTKSLPFRPHGASVILAWTPEDVGQAGNFNNFISSVRCLLPPGGAISSLYTEYPVEIGN